MHLIATREDLGTFAHVHPEPTGRPGELQVEMTFPTAGDYIVNTEFRQRGEMADVHQRQLVTVTGTAPEHGHAGRAGHAASWSTASGSELEGAALAGERSDLHFAFTDAGTGAPVDDLQPFLAAAGHVVVMKGDGTTFAHEHAEVEDEQGRPVFAVPGQKFGPELDVHAEFEHPRHLPALGPVPARRRRRPHRAVHGSGSLTGSPDHGQHEDPHPPWPPARPPRGPAAPPSVPPSAPRSAADLENPMNTPTRARPRRTRPSRLLSADRGWRGLVDGALPPLVFVAVNALAGVATGPAARVQPLWWALGAAAGTATVLTVLRLVRGETVDGGPARHRRPGRRRRLCGLDRDRRATSSCPASTSTPPTPSRFAGSVLVGRPLVGYIYVALFRPPSRDWRTAPAGCVACSPPPRSAGPVYGSGSRVQAALYRADEPELLALAKLAAGVAADRRRGRGPDDWAPCDALPGPGPPHEARCPRSLRERHDEDDHEGKAGQWGSALRFRLLGPMDMPSTASR